jgi:hypothetical protein
MARVSALWAHLATSRRRGEEARSALAQEKLRHSDELARLRADIAAADGEQERQSAEQQELLSVTKRPPPRPLSAGDCRFRPSEELLPASAAQPRAASDTPAETWAAYNFEKFRRQQELGDVPRRVFSELGTALTSVLSAHCAGVFSEPCSTGLRARAPTAYAVHLLVDLLSQSFSGTAAYILQKPNRSK